MDQNSNLENHQRRESYKLNDRKLLDKPKLNLTLKPQTAAQKTSETPSNYNNRLQTDVDYSYKTKKSSYSKKIEDNDTCLIGSVTQVDFENQMADDLAANLLKDISNRTRTVPEAGQFNFKLTEHRAGKENQSLKNFRGLEDSDKKNPLEMEFED